MISEEDKPETPVSPETSVSPETELETSPKAHNSEEPAKNTWAEDSEEEEMKNKDLSKQEKIQTKPAKKETSDALTKRLQKLALEHQKVSLNETEMHI